MWTKAACGPCKIRPRQDVMPPKPRGIPPRCPQISSLTLEIEFRAELHEAWRTGADHLAKSRTADISPDGLRSEKLRVIEYIEAFETELQRLRFRDTQILQQSKIEIVHARATEKPALGGSWRA